MRAAHGDQVDGAAGTRGVGLHGGFDGGAQRVGAGGRHQLSDQPEEAREPEGSGEGRIRSAGGRRWENV